MEFKEIINLIENVYGESNINCNRKRGSTYINVFYKKSRLMALVKSYTGGWISLIDFDFVGKGIDPFLVKDNKEEFLAFNKEILNRHKFIRSKRNFRNAC